MKRRQKTTSKFNESPRETLEEMVARGEGENIAPFLRYGRGLDPVCVGNVLGGDDTLSLTVLKQYTHGLCIKKKRSIECINYYV